MSGNRKNQQAEQIGDAKNMVAARKSPAKGKARDKAVEDAETLGAEAEKWLCGYQIDDSICDMRRSVYERELKPKFSNQKLMEITMPSLSEGRSYCCSCA